VDTDAPDTPHGSSPIESVDTDSDKAQWSLQGRTAAPETDWRELTAVILLSVTTILTAWSGFQASKWGGVMSISFSQASAARIEAVGLDGDANRKISVQVSLFTQWLQASASRNTEVAEYLEARFPEPLMSAFTAWQKTDPATNAGAPSSPFVMDEYVVPEQTAAEAANRRADGLFSQALEANQRGDNYTILTVAFASVLFFAAISGRMKSRRNQWVLLGVGLALFVVAAALLLSFPKLV
jgi:hypothetical protein